jgi:hypothetical protein
VSRSPVSEARKFGMFRRATAVGRRAAFHHNIFR